MGEGGGTWPVGDHVVGVRGEIPGQGHLSVYRPVNKKPNKVKDKISEDLEIKYFVMNKH